jgi:hypothetical protein
MANLADMLDEWGDEQEEDEWGIQEDKTQPPPSVTFEDTKEDDFYPDQVEEDINEDDEPQHEDYGGDEGEEFQTERNVFERTSYGNDESGPAEGQNPRMFYALRNQNRSEEEIFLDHYEKYCYQQVPPRLFNRTEHPFIRLLSKHPHPKFLNIALCVATLAFYNPATQTYEWNSAKYKPFEDLHTAHDVYRYIMLFRMYA